MFETITNWMSSLGHIGVEVLMFVENLFPPLWPFLIFTTLGSLVWTGFLAIAGFLLQSRYESVAAWIDPVSTTVVVLLIATYLSRLVRQIRRLQPT